MKKITLLAALLLAVTSLEAQKQEIKKAEQAVRAGNLSSALNYLEQVKQIFAAADGPTRAHFYVVEAEMKLASPNMDMQQMESISNSLEKANGYYPNATLGSRIAKVQSELNNMSAKAAAGEFRKKNYSAAAKLYNVAYQSTQDTLLFYHAAKSHLQGKEYEEAFLAYNRLFVMGFTNSRIQYVATNIQTKKKEAFKSPYLRNVAIEQGTHKKPEVVKSSSKTPELLRGITQASIQLNRNNSAVLIIDQALAKSPDDKSMLNQVFHLYRQLGATERYNKIMDLLIKESPNDPNMYYNFGVASAQGKDTDRAKEFYKKVLEIKPEHVNAKLGLSNIILDQETDIVEEMNNLGMTPEDDKRYDELKLEREKLYKEALPYLESIAELQPKNKEVVKTLMNIYSTIGQDSKLAVLKNRLDD